MLERMRGRGIFSIILSLILVNSVVDVCYADACSSAQASLKTAQLSMESAKNYAISAGIAFTAASCALAAAVAACAASWGLACLVTIPAALAAFSAASYALTASTQALVAAIQQVQSAQAAVDEACKCKNTGMAEGRIELGTKGILESDRTIIINNDTSAAMFLLDSKDKLISMNLVSPNGTKITQSMNLNGSVYYGKVNTTTYYFVLNPDPGIWIMEVKPFFAAEQGRDYMLLAYKFENGSLAEFSDYYSDYGVDDDANGLYDHIDIAVGVDIKTPGWYSISGSIKNSEENESIFAFNKTYLEQGNQSVNLGFYGMHYPGSYNLENLTLEAVMPPKKRTNEDIAADLLTDQMEGDRGLQDFRIEPYTTKRYDKPDRPINSPWSTKIIGIYSERVLDIDEDGQYDILSFDVGVNVAKMGNYTLMGRLSDQNNSEMAWAIYERNLEPGRQRMALDFDGREINEHGINGPYYLNNISLWGEDWMIIETMEYPHKTTAYDYSYFREE